MDPEKGSSDEGDAAPEERIDATSLPPGRQPSTEKSLSCSFCGKGFVYKRSLIKHQRLHIQANDRRLLASTNSEMAAHQRKLQGQRSTRQQLACSVCCITFATQPELLAHLSSSLVCQLPAKSVTVTPPLIATPNAAAPPSYIISPAVSSGAAAPLMLAPSAGFLNPGDTHLASPPSSATVSASVLPCRLCNRTFARQSKLNSHVTRDHGWFVCTICNQAFSQKVNLTSHTRTHTGTRPFACNICGSRFSLKGTLTTHIRTHTGERPFPCTICQKRFSRKTSLKMHMRTHTGEKPFHCTVCGKRFTQKGSLTTHMRLHTGEKPFSCQECSKRFSDRSSLALHMRSRVHRGAVEKPLKCDVCGRGFTYNGSLLSHRKAQHPNTLAPPPTKRPRIEALPSLDNALQQGPAEGAGGSRFTSWETTIDRKPVKPPQS